MRKFVLAHESLGYHVGEGIDRLGGYELHPIATLHLRRFACEERTYPRARRRTARAGTRGRRGAMRIPLVCRWEVGVYMAEDTPEPIAARLADRYMGEPVFVEWRRRERR